MQLDSTTTTIVAAAVGGGIAAIVGGGFTVLNLWLTRRSDERRQIRELAVRAAIENWKHYDEVSKRHGGIAQPLDVYILHATRLVSAIDGADLTPDEIRKRIRHALDAADAATKEIDDYNAKRNKGAA